MSSFVDWINGFQLPVGASTFAPVNDMTFFLLFMASVFFFVLIVGYTVYFCVKYRKKENDPIPPHITHNWLLEITWTIIPTIIVFWFFWIGAKGYLDMNVAPRNALNIDVQARQWKWDFFYHNGANDGELTVPVNRDVKLTMRSTDVIHAFFVPAFRTKMDVIPGRDSQTWFHATAEGKYRLYCAEFCGADHSRMITWVNVVSEEEYQNYLEAIDKPKSGEELFAANCIQCHSLNGKRIIGPPLNDIWGKTEIMEDGSSIVVDEAYFIESLNFPQKKILKGYKDVRMSTFNGLFKDEEVTNLINYVKSKTQGAQ